MAVWLCPDQSNVNYLKYETTQNWMNFLGGFLLPLMHSYTVCTVQFANKAYCTVYSMYTVYGLYAMNQIFGLTEQCHRHHHKHSKKDGTVAQLVKISGNSEISN